MRALTRPLAAVALAGGALLAQPATAASCVGEHSVYYVCVTLPTVGEGSTPLCVYAGGEECQPVNVPTPTVDGLPEVDAECGRILDFAGCSNPIAQCGTLRLEPVCA